MKNFAVPLVLLCCLTATQTQKSDAGKQSQPNTKSASILGAGPGCYHDIHIVLMELRAMEARLKAAESQIAELGRVNRDRPKIAFSASLGGDGDTGPFGVEITLVYKVVFTNIGNAYSPNTGIFTAPVKGVYYFRMSIFARGSGFTNAQLLKNGERIITADSHKTGDPFENSSNGASLLLEAGDQVYTRLWSGRHIFDNANHHSTFSGFLLFPM
ncbi:hypothetical protein MATL_G00231050 [Megalops atlanticus]|uniref:C1q domain-containing protein n=1 Tax=Megalops atlanticus TaxID=7932 RepID=A0A9D3SWC6_MEGAT|nr:hypothetical protein MATL_G00231050 [Megalops atlanticus]